MVAGALELFFETMKGRFWRLQLGKSQALLIPQPLKLARYISLFGWPLIAASPTLILKAIARML
jgi:hypothetical protein